jgi:hypothetical protein
MPLSRYVKGGVAFPPEAVSAMSEAFVGALADLAIGPEDEKRRAVVAHFIIDLAGAGDTDAANLREQAGKTFGGLAWWARRSNEAPNEGC